MDKGQKHRKRVKHYHCIGDFHELTFSCYHGMPLLTCNSWRRQLSKSIDAACAELLMELVAFCYMPEHVHMLIFPLEPDPAIDEFLSAVKRPLSDFVKGELLATGSKLLQRLTVQERPRKQAFRFWQEGPGFDRNLFTPSALQSSIDYIHNNPVRRHLCKRAVDWKWSSARYYLLDPPCQQFAELPVIHGIRPQAFDSDISR